MPVSNKYKSHVLTNDPAERFSHQQYKTQRNAHHTELFVFCIQTYTVPCIYTSPKHRNYAGKYLICTLDINVFLKIMVFKSQMHRQHVYQKSKGLFSENHKDYFKTSLENGVKRVWPPRN